MINVNMFFIKNSLFFVVVLFALRAYSSECEYLSLEEAALNSENSIVVEKLYSGLNYHQFLLAHGNNSNTEVVEAWSRYRSMKEPIQFLVKKILFSDKYSVGDIISIESSPVLDFLYNVGDEYIIFLDFYRENLHFYSCDVVNLTLRKITTRDDVIIKAIQFDKKFNDLKSIISNKQKQ